MPSSETTYSSWVGVIYVFNLIVGTGALTLPAVFAKAGWLLSTICLLLLSFMSFISVTFIIECIACANATSQRKRIKAHKVDEESDEVTIESDGETNESTAIIKSVRNHSKYFSLNETIPLGRMASLYFSKWGVILFYAALCIYLYGDLTIYTTVVGQSITMVICPLINETMNTTGDDYEDSCWEGAQLKRNQVYQISVTIFFLLLAPFAYFNVQKTKYIQMFTTAMRWCAFMIMVVVAIVLIYVKGPQGQPKVFEITSVSAVLGASVYSFMCHHSLPNIVSPISNKLYIVRQLFVIYILICIFYLLLSLTGIFAFADLNDLYTLNFIPHSSKGVFMNIIAYFLNLFPIFTLSTSFPIIAIALQSNLKSQFLDENTMDNYNFILRKLTFPTVAVLPPILIALSTHNLGTLVKVTGAYGGVCIQFIIPAILVFAARKHCQVELGNAYNQYASIFQGMFWIAFVIIWGLSCMILVTVNFFS